jgi:hypothetical protein
MDILLTPRGMCARAVRESMMLILLATAGSCADGTLAT